MRGHALLAAATLVLAGCLGGDGDGEEPEPSPQEPSFGATSPAFDDGGEIPRVFTCDGEERSPPLEVAGAPRNATTIALVVGDPDAPFPQAPLRNFTHWLAWNAPLAEGRAAFAEDGIPEGTVEGTNDGGSLGWIGPCPPPASPAHRYVFTVHAVNGTLDLAEGATREALEAALVGKVAGTTTLTGTYARAVP